MIINAGSIRQDTRIGELHLNWPLPEDRLEMLVSAIERGGIDIKWATAATMDENGAITFTMLKHDGNGKSITDERVLPVEYEVRVAADA